MPDLIHAVENSVIHISARAKATLEELAAKEGRPPEAVLDAAIDEYSRELFFGELNEGYARLQADPEAWADYEEESRLWHQLCDQPDPK